jgi:hypothetical protein
VILNLQSSVPVEGVSSYFSSDHAETCNNEDGNGKDGCIPLHPRHGGRVCFYKGEEALERCMIHPRVGFAGS